MGCDGTTSMHRRAGGPLRNNTARNCLPLIAPEHLHIDRGWWIRCHDGRSGQRTTSYKAKSKGYVKKSCGRHKNKHEWAILNDPKLHPGLSVLCGQRLGGK